jgi:hypothetical protein
MKRIKTVVGSESRNQSRLKTGGFDADTKKTIQVILKQTHPDRGTIFRLGRESTSIEVAGTPVQTHLVEILAIK